jgi:hypothetical protein
MTRQEYDAFIDQETTNALVIFNDDITTGPIPQLSTSTRFSVPVAAT